MTRNKQTEVGRHKRTAAQIERDRADIVQQWLRGSTHREIVGWVIANRPYTISKTQVTADLRHTVDEWKEERLRLYDDYVQKQLMKYQLMEKVLWEAWEKSIQPITRTQKKVSIGEAGSTSPTEASITTENRHGDMRIIQALLNVQVLIQRLLGLDGSVGFFHDDGKTIGTATEAVTASPRVVIYLPDNGREKNAPN